LIFAQTLKSGMEGVAASCGIPSLNREKDRLSGIIP
jgi:hypothetical protein